LIKEQDRDNNELKRNLNKITDTLNLVLVSNDNISDDRVKLLNNLWEAFKLFMFDFEISKSQISTCDSLSNICISYEKFDLEKFDCDYFLSILNSIDGIYKENFHLKSEKKLF
jgi:hypothetical protein